MSERTRIGLCAVTQENVERVVSGAYAVLEEVGVVVDLAEARGLLCDAGAHLGADQRVRIPAHLVDRALRSAPGEVLLYDRGGQGPQRIGGDGVHFAPGSAVVQVLDYELGEIRPATQADCVSFARLVEALPAITLQSTCLLPGDVPAQRSDGHRLWRAIQNCRKPVVTGAFSPGSFESMHRMLVAVRGSEQSLREKPYAIFDCCATAPLRWSELPCSALLACARHGVPAEIVSMPMTGATAPVTLLGAVTQHAAENLAGLVMHQLAAEGAPVIYGGAPSAFDMRKGTNPMGAVETMLIDAAYARVGKHLGLPIHSFMSLSDAKTLDYQAGLESGFGALLAVLAGINTVSGPGMLAFAGCQSLEKLVLDHEACRMALRVGRGLEWRDGSGIVQVISDGVAASRFVSLPHTQRWFKQELHFPGRSIDRHVIDTWLAAGGGSAGDRAHAEVEEILTQGKGCPVDAALDEELQRLAQVP